MSEVKEQKKRKGLWWKILLGLFAFFVVVAALTGNSEDNAENGSNNTATTQANEEQAADEQTNENPAEAIIEEQVEKEERVATTTTEQQKLTLEDIYDKVSLGMTKEQVEKIAGEPNMESEADIQQLGKVVNLVYNEGMDNITISVQNGTVKMIVIGRFDEDGNMKTKTKM